jgi:hypothetical protein
MSECAAVGMGQGEERSCLARCASVGAAVLHTPGADNCARFARGAGAATNARVSGPTPVLAFAYSLDLHLRQRDALYIPR